MRANILAGVGLGIASASLLINLGLLVVAARLSARVERAEQVLALELEERPSEELRVRSLTVVDSRGEPRIELQVNERSDGLNSARLALNDADGSGMVVLDEGEGGSQIFLRQTHYDGLVLGARPHRGGHIQMAGPIVGGRPSGSRELLVRE